MKAGSRGGREEHPRLHSRGARPLRTVRGSAGTVIPVTFDAALCIGCNICVEVCQVDIMLPNPEEGLPPVIAFPGECWYDGSCVAACPVPGAISLNRLAKDRVHYRRKETGQGFFI